MSFSAISAYKNPGGLIPPLRFAFGAHFHIFYPSFALKGPFMTASPAL